MFKKVLLIVLLWLLPLYILGADEDQQVDVSQQNQQNSSENIKSDNLNEKKSSQKAALLNSERFYEIKIKLKILDDGKNELVNSDWKLATLSGKPVSIQLKGNNLLIKADMTPYYSDRNSILLLTQANVKLIPAGSDTGKFYSTVNSLPIKLGEKALFFPLGLLDEKMENISSCVLEIEVQPYDNVEMINEPGSEKVGEEIKKE